MDVAAGRPLYDDAFHVEWADIAASIVPRSRHVHGGLQRGVELAQLLAVSLLFPSLYLPFGTPADPAVGWRGRLTRSLAAALGWALDRLGLLGNPFAGRGR